MDVTVQHRFKNIQHYNNCKTVEDLRNAIAENPNYRCHSDIYEWKLFYLGVQLDNEEELEDLNPDLTKKPFIILEEPPDIPRWGWRHPFIAENKTRFVVTGNHREYNVTAIRPNDIASYECPHEYYFGGNQKFGLITNIHKEDEARRVEIDVYNLPFNKAGWVMLWEDPKSKIENIKAPQVHLIIDPDRNRFEVLKPRALKIYDEENMKFENKKNKKANTHMEEILEELADNGEQPTPPMDTFYF